MKNQTTLSLSSVKHRNHHNLSNTDFGNRSSAKHQVVDNKFDGCLQVNEIAPNYECVLPDPPFSRRLDSYFFNLKKPKQDWLACQWQN